ncbi:MAG TPA: DUF935 family protein [Chloroflexi bacterium]|nr:DUF935 family protein [Chloroflexota bacterium]
MERQPLISRLYNKRRQAVLSKDLQITPAREDDPQALQAADLATEMIQGIDGQGGITDLQQGLFDLTDGIGKAFAVCQTVWRLDGGRFTPSRLVRWPQQNFQLGDPTKHYDGNVDQVRIVTDQHHTDGVPLEDFGLGAFICHKQKNWSQPLARAALFRAVTWYWLFGNYGIRDWSIFLERIGIPPRLGKYGPAAKKADRDALWQAVLNMGKDHACIMPDNSTIELLETKGLTSGAPHPQFIAHLNDQISIAISGNTMSVTQGERGARSAKEAFQTDEGEQTEFDATNLAKTIREQLVTPIVRANLGPNFPIPKVGFLFDEEEDLEARSKVDTAWKKAGKAIPVSYVVEKYGIPEPEGDEEVLGASEGAGAPGPAEDEDDVSRETLPVPNHAALVAAATQALRESGLPEKKSSVDWVISMMLNNGQ